MASITFADISTFSVGSTQIAGIISCSVNEPQEMKPIFCWNDFMPAIKIAMPTLGSGSFTYVASDGTGSSLKQNYVALLNGTTDITIVARDTTGTVVTNSGVTFGTTTITLKNCAYQGKSFGMNARSEATVTINFAFDSGLNG